MENNEEHINNEDITENNTQSELPKKENNTRRLQAYAIMFFSAVLLFLLIFFVYQKKFGSEEEETTVNTKSLPKNKVEKKEFNFPKPSFDDFFKKTAEPKENKPVFQVKEKPLPPVKVVSTKKPASLTPKLIKGSSSALVKNVGSKSSASTLNNNVAALEGNPLSVGEVPQALGTNTDYVGDTFTPTSAKMLNFNPSLLLPKGTYIGCSLNTRVISEITGSIGCTVSDSIYSSDGKVLLVEKGSKINGTFKNAQMNDGMSRIFVVWQEIRTPNHLVIPVYSGASDELGGSGLEGEVNHKWMLRFGSAVLLSAIDDIFNVLAYNLNGKEDTSSDIDYTENSRENAKNMSSIALEKFINIRPTLYKNHGDLVGVYVNRDIDFSKVYRLKKSTARLIK